ncbi:Lon protease [Anaerohalosphaera lusitana]|uniref:endopeptidase La n=1 Tax=Anaerohalosphaera lusitana TaxID=1936003 RepID=A0A1U9NKJ6_9BACT|nr:ATP-binding protein [Anaerohalosphaera lusitana]AQT68451.1 Lon protease [Anaerohalosphaera lusitana]
MTKQTKQARKTQSHKLKKANEPVQLTPDEVDIDFKDGTFAFKNTSEVEPLEEILGQDKAMNAIEVGLGIPQDGYNIYVAGLTGTGKMNTVKRSLKKRLDGSKVPADWVYVHNFEDPDQPRCMKLKPGKGKQLQKDMSNLVERLQQALPKAFRQEDFSKEKQQLSAKYQKKTDEMIEDLRNDAKERGFEMNLTSEGGINFIPKHDDKPIENQEQYDELPQEEKDRIEEGQQELTKKADCIIQQQRDIMQELTEEVRQIEKRFTSYVVQPMIEAIKSGYQDNDEILNYLDQVADHILDNLEKFQQNKQQNPTAALMQGLTGGGGDAQPRFLEYQVNLIVDHHKSKTAPVVIEEAPTYQNLFGHIERTADARGRLVTNHTQIKAGSILRANGGYVVFNIEDALTEPFVYKNLKRVLKSGTLQIESLNPFMPFSTGGLRPQPIPVSAKVVVVGSPLIYQLLRHYDDEFASIFKIRADFGTEMNRDKKQQFQYVQFIARLARDEKLLPLDNEAAKEIVRFGSRQASDKQKLVTKFSEVADILRESNYFAQKDDADTITADHILKALDNRVYRTNRIAEKIREMIDEGSILIDTEGTAPGQVNGLGVLDLGDYMFGKPSRVTASVGLGTDGLINIERESKLSGSTHDKGVLILGGYIRNMFGKDKPLALSASICFEQNYAGVDGDSASAAELLALLSAISGVPIRQDIGITGSINQFGQIQAIGGVNEKVEGFFDVCKTKGITGTQGVCIPQSNVKNLILRKDVRKAIEEGEFHIYPVTTVDQALELLTGKQAGTPDQKGTIFHEVDTRLHSMAEELKNFASQKK